MKAVFFNSSRLVKWFLPFYLLTFLPLHAQVGTWENYLAYHELQNICAASNNQLFVLAISITRTMRVSPLMIK